MSDTTFVNGSTLSDADWFNDVNRLHYTIFADPADIAAVKATLHAAPGAIGGTTPAAGTFTTIKSTSATGEIGFGTGAGGAVTQLTNKSTAVTLNNPCGQITMNNALLANNTNAVFTLNNSLIAAKDTIIVNLANGSFASGGTYQLWAEDIGAGSCLIAVRNISGGNLSEALVINFVIIKAVIS